MSSLEEQKKLLDKAEDLIEKGDANTAMDKLSQVTHEDLQSKRDFLISQAERNARSKH